MKFKGEVWFGYSGVGFGVVSWLRVVARTEAMDVGHPLRSCYWPALDLHLKGDGNFRRTRLRAYPARIASLARAPFALRKGLGVLSATLGKGLFSC